MPNPRHAIEVVAHERRLGSLPFGKLQRRGEVIRHVERPVASAHDLPVADTWVAGAVEIQVAGVRITVHDTATLVLGDGERRGHALLEAFGAPHAVGERRPAFPVEQLLEELGRPVVGELRHDRLQPCVVELRGVPRLGVELGELAEGRRDLIGGVRRQRGEELRALRHQVVEDHDAVMVGGVDPGVHRVGHPEVEHRRELGEEARLGLADPRVGLTVLAEEALQEHTCRRARRRGRVLELQGDLGRQRREFAHGSDVRDLGAGVGGLERGGEPLG